jgi:prepilin-type N-terminal cleavage/methylation domain-containing protein
MRVRAVRRRGRNILQYKYPKGFTLLEVLVVLVLVGLIFTLVLTVFWRITETSSEVSKRASKLQRETTLYWQLTRSFFGTKRLAVVNGTQIYAITTGGSLFKGTVWCAYLYRNGTLYYYEYPYPPPYSIKEIPREASEIILGKFKSVKFSARKGGIFYSNFEGKPDTVKVELNGESFLFAVGG